jgi:hypothetical protein
LSEVRAHLGPYYSDVGRPSIDPELMIRMLMVGYCMGIRAPRAKSLSNSDAPMPFPEAASQPRAQDSIAPANWIATSASSRRVAAPTQSPARSRGICTKTRATWLVRTPQHRNSNPLSSTRKSGSVPDTWVCPYDSEGEQERVVQSVRVPPRRIRFTG